MAPLLAVCLSLCLFWPVPVADPVADPGRPSAPGGPFSVPSSQPGDRFGAAVAAAGDVNRDGWPDVLVGAPRAEPAGSLSGRAVVLSGRDGSELLAWEGDDPFDALGWSLCALGDLDGDGHADLALGSPAGTPGSGSVRLVSGREGRLLATLVGEAVGDRFGHAVCALGDVNADGVGDLAVSAPHSDAAGNQSGRVYVISGADGSWIRVLDGGPFDHFGQSLAGAGDLNADGRGDLLVGAPLSDLGAFNGGSAYLISGRDGGEIAAFHGAQIGDQLGHWVANAGDLDGDGTIDLALGAPGDDGGGLDAGAVTVRSGATGALLLRVTGDATGEGLGVVAGVGDVDGDGRDDLALGAATAGIDDTHVGRVRVISGATGQDLADVLGRRPFGWFGFALAGVGDLDGDGRADVVSGAPGHDDVLSVIGSVRAVRVP